MVTVPLRIEFLNQMTSSYPRVPLSSLDWLGSGLISFGVFRKDPRGLGLCFFLALISPSMCPDVSSVFLQFLRTPQSMFSCVFVFPGGGLSGGRARHVLHGLCGPLGPREARLGGHMLRMGKMLC